MPEYLCVRNFNKDIITIPLKDLKGIEVFNREEGRVNLLIMHHNKTDVMRISLSEEGYDNLCKKLESI